MNKISNMADNRLPHMVGQGGVHQAPGFSHLQGGIGVGMVVNPVFGGPGAQSVSGQQPHLGFFPGMAAPMMRVSPVVPAMFPVQQMRPPAGPPPPYTPQLAATYQAKARSPTSLQSPRGPMKLKTEKERYFEQQQQRLRQFGKPGAPVADANKLIENMFGKTEKSHPGHHSGTGHIVEGSNVPQSAGVPAPITEDEDDGFGDFLGGPSTSAQLPNTTLDTSLQYKPAPSSHSSFSAGSPVNNAAAPGADHKYLPRETVERKDLMSMMMQCSDLKAPQKAKGFHKPSLIEVQRTGSDHGGRAPVFHESDHARRWTSTEDLEGLFVVQSRSKTVPVTVSNHAPEVPLPPSPSSATVPSSAHLGSHAGVALHDVEAAYPPSAGLPQSFTTSLPSASHHHPTIATQAQPFSADHYQTKGTGLKSSRALPEWCCDSGQNLPVVYRQVLEACSEGEEIITARLYPILLLSQLPREQLGQLWNLVNTQTPGQLIRSELWMLLALIALVQNQFAVTSLDILKRCPQAPVPFLAQPSVHASNMADNSTSAASAPPISPGTRVQEMIDKPEHVPQSHASYGSYPSQTHIPHPVQTTVTTGSPAVLPVQTEPQETEDDFADFQAAPSNSPQLTVATVSSTSPSKNCVNFTIGSKAVKTDHSLPSAPAAAAERLETLYMEKQYVHKQQLESISTEDKYASNVRSFFCSSDSSTGHTTPNSLDEDDFTDGHDSLSQVSTSEQSENEDIRAFENYVEEISRKREVQTPHSALQCPFPKKSTGMCNAGDIGSSTSAGIITTRGQEVMASKQEMKATRNAVPPVIPTLPPMMNRAGPPTGSFPQAMTSDDDFTDFKSAGSPTSKKGEFMQLASASSPEEVPPGSVGDMPLIGEEDKYGALRGLTSNQPSLFEQRGDQNNSSVFLKPGVHSEQVEEEEWADFSSPAAPSSGVAGSTSSGSGEKAFAGAGLPLKDAEEDGWANFEMAEENSPTCEREKSGFMSVQFETGYFTSSLRGDSSLPGLQSPSPIRQKHAADRTLPVASIRGNSSAPVLHKNMEDDWADFATAVPGSPAQNVSHTPITDGIESLQSACTKEGSSVSSEGHTSETYVGKDQSAVVTIKKKNLETREILGLFKVRSDPATLSSYELSRHVSEHVYPEEKAHHADSVHHQRSRSGSKDRRASSDGDDAGPPPLDSIEDYDDEHEYGISRGYDLDDMMHQPVPTTVYSPFGFGAASSRYTSSVISKTTRASKGTQETRCHSLSPDSGESDSLSHRISSLKEDSQSISSLELPATRIPADAHRDSDNGGTDSQSVSSMEFGAVERSGRGDIAAESKSLDSLDLCSDHMEPEDIEDDARNGRTSTGPGISGMFGQVPILGDRYNIDGQAEGSDRYAFEWERCLSSCSRLIHDANNILNTISSSAICNEVLRSPQGTDYIIGVIEIYRVVCRVIAALSTTAINSPTIERSLKDIDLAWNNLTAFLVGASLLPDETSLNFAYAVLKSDGPAAQQKACGVCLLDVDQQGPNSNGDIMAKLSYGGRQYHAPCANFWVNCVDSMLPALRLPDLL
ncbi:synergin gamma-like isoform X3 [Pomacea canaliculata]|nr:synergin gamma-like isoform X3 [Pomacea canaliculata]